MGGRNSDGHITVRHHGGGHKKYYRIIDFKRNKRDIPGVVETIEYDPNRSCFIALIKYSDGERRYILATANMKAGMKVVAAETCEISEGNCLPLINVPSGTMVPQYRTQGRQGRPDGAERGCIRRNRGA